MEAKMPGEDYMGDVYEGYIPGALEELHNDGTAFIANVFHIDKVDGQNWTFLLTPYIPGQIVTFRWTMKLDL